MGLVSIPTWMVDFYGFHVAKYTSPIHGMLLMGLDLWNQPTPRNGKETLQFFLLTLHHPSELLEEFDREGWTTHLKNMCTSKMGSSSPKRGENKKYLKPTPSLIYGWCSLQTANYIMGWHLHETCKNQTKLQNLLPTASTRLGPS